MICHKSIPVLPFLKGWLSATVLVCGWAGALWAQDNTTPVPLPLPKGGLQISSISGYAVYYSNGLPTTGSFQPGVASAPADAGMGGSVVFDWTKFTERTTFSLSYTPSYTGRVKYTSLDALNHALSMNFARKLSHRWNFGFSAAGNLSTLDEFLFAPTALSNVASVPSTFNDLASALTSSKFTNNPQLGIALTGAPLVQSPFETLLYGERMFTSSAQASLSFSYSPRLSVTFSGGGGRTQHLSDDQNSSGINTYLIPDTTTGRAGVALSYSYSPVWQFGATVNTDRISSSFVDAYITTSLANVSRTLGRRWILQLHGGVGFTNPVRQTHFPISTAPLPAAGGSLAFKTSSHTFLGSFDRTASDLYGLGAANTSTGNAVWRWRHPGYAWWLESSIGWQQLQGNTVINTSGWHASAGFGRAINTQLTFLAEYAYLNYSGGLQTAGYKLSQSAVRVSLMWTPRPVVPRVVPR